MGDKRVQGEKGGRENQSEVGGMRNVGVNVGAKRCENRRVGMSNYLRELRKLKGKGTWPTGKFS